MPNVIRSNDGRTSIKGAREDQAAILVNGSLSNDPATGRFQVEIPLEALQRAEIFTNPYLPEYGKFTSGVKRLETKPGGQQWKYSLYDFFPSVRARYGKIFGLANVSPAPPSRVHSSATGCFWPRRSKALWTKPSCADWPARTTKSASMPRGVSASSMSFCRPARA